MTSIPTSCTKSSTSWYGKWESVFVNVLWDTTRCSLLYCLSLSRSFSLFRLLRSLAWRRLTRSFSLSFCRYSGSVLFSLILILACSFSFDLKYSPALFTVQTRARHLIFSSWLLLIQIFFGPQNVPKPSPKQWILPQFTLFCPVLLPFSQVLQALLRQGWGRWQHLLGNGDHVTVRVGYHGDEPLWVTSAPCASAHYRRWWQIQCHVFRRPTQ